MNIAIFGLGYVGTTMAACLARDGHRVIGVDNVAAKVEALSAGRPSFREPQLDGLIRDAVAAGRLAATVDPADAVRASDCSMVCVGTPALADGALDVRALVEVVGELADLIQRKAERHCLIIRSTVLPGTIDELLIPMIEQRTGMVAGRDYGLSYFPEFMREASAIADHDSPGTVVYSASDPATARLLADLNRSAGVAHHEVAIRTAEAAKLLNNAWHAAKVSFANEFGLILNGLGVDSHAAFSLLCSDTKLNISPAYLMPAFAFGGSCLPKDLGALRHSARARGLETPYIDGVFSANRRQIARAVDLVRASGPSRVTLLGLSFKPDTDDLRNSPYVELAAELLDIGHHLAIVDRNISSSGLLGANRDFSSLKLPDLEGLLTRDAERAIADCDVLIVADRRQAEEHLEAIGRHRPQVVDLARSASIAALDLPYHGICW